MLRRFSPLTGMETKEGSISGTCPQAGQRESCVHGSSVGQRLRLRGCLSSFFFFSVTHEAIILLHCSFALQEPLGKIWRYMWWSRLGDAVGISWVEARDAAKHPKVQGHPTIKSRPALMSAVPWSGNCYISKNHRCSVILRLCSLCLFCFCYCVSKRVFRIVASVLPGQGFYWVGLITPETVALGILSLQNPRCLETLMEQVRPRYLAFLTNTPK